MCIIKSFNFLLKKLNDLHLKNLTGKNDWTWTSGCPQRTVPDGNCCYFQPPRKLEEFGWKEISLLLIALPDWLPALSQ
jgi:hypothetical protein